MKLKEKRQKEEEEPPKYFTRQENEETIRMGNIVDYFNIDKTIEDRPKYTYSTGATYKG